jgi:Family of unknown function (DUF6632)
MDNQTKEKYLKMALVVFGIVFLLVYPLGMIWPSGWIWHGGQGTYYFQMICGIYAVLGIFLIAAARNPAANRSLIAFTIWSSLVHAAIMRRRPSPTVRNTVTSLAMFRPCWWPRPSFGSFRRGGNGSSAPRASSQRARRGRDEHHAAGARLRRETGREGAQHERDEREIHRGGADVYVEKG